MADLLVLTLIGANVVLNPPQLRYFSSLLHLRGAFDADVLSGIVTMLCVLLMALYVWTCADVTRERFRLRLSIVLVAVLFLVVLPTLADVSARAVSGLKEYGRFIAFPHDGGVLQTEAAIELLLQGQNPYTADYAQTAMAQSHHSAPGLWQGMGLAQNPALSFFPYPPLTFLSGVPLYAAAKASIGWYDQRFVYLLALWALAALVPWVTSRRPLQLVLLAWLTLCPWETRYFVQGYNDLLCTTLLIAVIAAMHTKRLALAGLFLALACGAKQFAWFAVPLFFMEVAARAVAEEEHTRRRRKWLYPLVAFALPTTLLFAPFLLWNPSALIHNLVVAQGYEYPFRIQGLGASNLFVLLGWVEEPMSRFFGQAALQALVLPVIAIAGWRIWRGGGLYALLTGLAATILAFVFVSRHFATNYLYLPSALVACAFMLQVDAQQSGLKGP